MTFISARLRVSSAVFTTVSYTHLDVYKRQDVSMQGYFNICRLKMDTSKKRKSSGSKGGISKKRKVSTVETDSILKNDFPTQESSAEEVSALPLTYEQFRSEHRDLQGDLFGNAERYKTCLLYTSFGN